MSLRKGFHVCVDLASCPLQVLNESPNAARALDLIKQQEMTKAAEHQRQQAEYAAYVKQMEVRVLLLVLPMFTGLYSDFCIGLCMQKLYRLEAVAFTVVPRVAGRVSLQKPGDVWIDVPA